MTSDDAATILDFLAALDMRLAALENVVIQLAPITALPTITAARETMRLEVTYAFDNAVSDAWRPPTKPPETQESP